MQAASKLTPPRQELGLASGSSPGRACSPRKVGSPERIHASVSRTSLERP